MLPCAIVTVLSGIAPFEPVHPLNVYPVFVGLFNVMFALSTVYVVGFSVETDPPSKLYVIVYSIVDASAVAVTVVAAAGIVSVVSVSVVLANIDVSVVVHAKFEYSYPAMFAYSADIVTSSPHLYVSEPAAFAVFVPAITVNANVFLV